MVCTVTGFVIFCTVFVGITAQGCSLMCGPGHTCALVREGHGPAVPDCLSNREARLLDRALHGGPTGPGTGRLRNWRRHHGGGFGQGGGFGFLDPLSGGAGIGVGGAGPHVGVVNPGGVGPGVIDDRSRNIHLNITIGNTNINQHDQSGGGGTQVNNPNPGVPIGPIVVPI